MFGIGLVTEKFDHFNAEWQKKTPKQKWNKFYSTGKYMADLVQIGVFETDLTLNRIGWLGYYPFFHGFGYISLAIYTINFYIARDQFAECLKVFCFFGILIGAYVLYITVVTDMRYTWTRLMNVSGEYIYRDDSEPTSYNLVCSKCIDNSILKFIVIITLEMMSFVIANIGEFYSALQGKKITLCCVRLPFVHEKPDLEFILNFIWEELGAVDGFFSFVAIEIGFMLVNDTITLTSRLCELDFIEASEEMERYQCNRSSIKNARKRLHMTLKRTRFIDGYIDDFSELQYWRLFVAPLVLTFSMAISIYCQFTSGYAAGYALAVTSYVQMAVMCYTGQNVVDRNDALLDAYYDFKWYYLPIADQKYVLHMVHRMQNGMDLTIGPLEQLNYETLKILSQKVYSFLMFLVNFET